MRIGIFTNVLAYKPSGIGWHVIHLLDHLAKIDTHNEYFLLHRVPLTGERPKFHCPAAPNFRNVPIRTPDLFYGRYFRVFDQWQLPRAIRKLKLDVFHGPNHYLPAHAGVPQVVTYHDIAEAKFQLGTPAEQARQKEALTRCLSRADRVIALSECTKRDVCEYGFPPDRAHVIYQGGNFDHTARVTDEEVAAVKKHFNIPGRYILFVGSLVPRKNIGFLLDAYAKLAVNPGHPTLVLAGADTGDEAKRLKDQADKLGIRQSIVFTGYLTSEQMRALYGGAAVFAIPSMYEGFGMIALEAMIYRAPIVSTRAGSLEEVIADAGLLVNLGDVESFAGAIKRVLDDETLAKDLIAKGRRRVAEFDWMTTAKQTLELYQRVVEEGPRS